MPKLTWYRNTGAAFPVEDGTRVGTGDIFVPTADCLKRRRNKLEYVARSELPTWALELEAEIGGPDDVPDAPSDSPEWTLAMTPADYLSRYPTGQHAELARQLVDATDDPDGDE